MRIYLGSFKLLCFPCMFYKQNIVLYSLFFQCRPSELFWTWLQTDTIFDSQAHTAHHLLQAKRGIMLLCMCSCIQRK
ncbi:uncharacterized protein [Arachis hypogaea]|uniref:uncharacterized protein n=1 Tax=Arachis hypogaea TaxID=3818 RepID=UPI0010FC4910|nr:uncharacterized protein LOC112733020 [Arachis hypogaea]